MYKKLSPFHYYFGKEPGQTPIAGANIFISIFWVFWMMLSASGIYLMYYGVEMDPEKYVLLYTNVIYITSLALAAPIIGILMRMDAILKHIDGTPDKVEENILVKMRIPTFILGILLFIIAIVLSNFGEAQIGNIVISMPMFYISIFTVKKINDKILNYFYEDR